jgi:hypothetical protein
MEQIEQLFKNANKSDVLNFTDSLIHKIEEGIMSPIVALKIRKIADTINSSIDDGIKSRNISFSKEDSGNSLEIQESSIFDYRVCQDDILSELEAQQKELSLMISERKKFLSSIPKDGLNIVDDNTGELKKIYPPNKGLQVRVTLK